MAFNPYDSVPGHLLRSVGLPLTWLLLALALYTTVTDRPGKRRALLLGASPLVAAGLGVVLKLLIARPRPGPNLGATPLGDWAASPWYSGNFGMPSIDAAVVGAAAAILSLAWPKGRLWWVSIALLCAAARVVSGAHHVSDVVVGLLLGGLVALGLWRAFRE